MLFSITTTSVKSFLFGALLSFGGLVCADSVHSAEAGNSGPQIPKAFLGAWSTDLKLCGKDSDGNYVIGSTQIQAWEVSWDVSQVSVEKSTALRIRATHREYEHESRVVITITQFSPRSMVFKECEQGSCWQVTLRKCSK